MPHGWTAVQSPVVAEPNVTPLTHPVHTKSAVADETRRGIDPPTRVIPAHAAAVNPLLALVSVLTAAQVAPLADHVTPFSQGVQIVSAMFVDATQRPMSPPVVVVPVQSTKALDAMTVPSPAIQKSPAVAVQQTLRSAASQTAPAQVPTGAVDCM